MYILQLTLFIINTTKGTFYKGDKQMNITFAKTIRHYNKKNLPNDILAGIVIALVSIPISMGYASIAGLPAIYGLYGSIFPTIIFSLFTTSKEFVFGVDAAPVAIVGSALTTLHINEGSEECIRIVPVITLFVAVWLLIFYIIKAGKLVNFISTPVMGGFISGICSTIILMQIPKLLGGTIGTGELLHLTKHLIKSFSSINYASLILGIISLIILFVSKKFIPKFPMAVVVMFTGAIISKFSNLFENNNITCLKPVSAGLPSFFIPSINFSNVFDVIGISLSVAVVIVSETLLAENSFARKNDYDIDNNQEILAFCLGNLLASITGCCPINGSVSRSSLKEQYKGKTGLTGIIAGISMMFILIFATGFIKYLPVPVLTSIVIFALVSATEFHIATELWRVNKKEFAIFCGAFLGVLLLGTINGVLIGILLSFTEVIIRDSEPPRCFLGIIPGHTHFQDLNKFKNAYPIKNTVIYKFNGNLFFANINIFVSDIKNSIKDDTKAVIIDASAIGCIDITAAKQLEQLYISLKKQEIKLYLTEHISDLNDQLRQFNIGYLIEKGAVRRTINLALKDIGIRKPYILDGYDNKDVGANQKRAENQIQEFVWAFGDKAEEQIESLIVTLIEKLKTTGDIETLLHGIWNHLDIFDEEEWLEHLEIHLKEIVTISKRDEDELAKAFEKRRIHLKDVIEKEHPELRDTFIKRHDKLDAQLKTRMPDIYEKIQQIRSENK